jgi:hypothetical protein
MAFACSPPEAPDHVGVRRPQRGIDLYVSTLLRVLRQIRIDRQCELS